MAVAWRIVGAFSGACRTGPLWERGRPVSTAGAGTLNAALYAIMLACSISAGCSVLGQHVGRLFRRPPLPAAALWLAVAIPSLLQAPFPGLLYLLEREPGLISGHGQWWRLLTSAVVQDGGSAGTVFNRASLAVVGVVAVRVWGGWRALVIFAGAAVAFNLAATFASPSAGAGNSGGTFALATSVTGFAVVARRDRAAALLTALTVVCGVALLALLDAHGEVVLGGLLTGILICAVSPPPGIASVPGYPSADHQASRQSP